MILVFPDFETLRLATGSGQIPPAMLAAPLRAAFAPDGPVAVDTEEALPKAAAATLKKLGVKTGRTLSGEVREYASWPQMFPLTKDPHVPEVTPQSVVLFDLPAAQLAGFVTEMLRLGNDRQSFRYLTSATDRAEVRVLLRVIGPPYYSLLRAIDAAELASGISAYTEASRGVWVSFGWSHPLAGRFQPAPGQTLLIDAPDRWIDLEEAPFADIYDILDLKLSGHGVDWQSGELKNKLSIPLRLGAASTPEPPEMWVFRGDGVKQLDAFVRDADERLLSRLAFAVTEEKAGPPTVALRTRTSRLAPPVLTLADAVAYRPYWKLPNLFLPLGTRLLPTLRRESVRQLLAEDPGTIVWLDAGDNGTFVPQMLPDTAFRPLEDWVDYVISRELEPLRSWIEKTEFDFEGYTCPEERTTKPKDPPERKPKEPNRSTVEPAESAADRAARTARRPSRRADESTYSPPVVSRSHVELKKRRLELETQFFAAAGPLDAPERLALWPELAAVYAALGEANDAAICWLDRLWEDDSFSESILRDWANSELEETPGHALKASEPRLAAMLKVDAPSPIQLRALVAYVLWLAASPEGEAIVLKHLKPLRDRLEVGERHLSVRAAWLVAYRLSRIGSGGKSVDVLALARSRDRLLQRLLEEGLNKERDLPTFLRLSGSKDSERMRLIRERIHSMRTLTENWLALDHPDITEVNRAYSSLIYAFGAASLGEATTARDMMGEAEGPLLAKRDSAWPDTSGGKQTGAGVTWRKRGDGVPDLVHVFLFDAFRDRIEGVLAGRPPAGLSADLTARLETLPRFARYLVDRMREQSRILAPQEKFDPYRNWKKQTEDIQLQLSGLPDIANKNELEVRIQSLTGGAAASRQSPIERLVVLKVVIPLSPRVGEEFALRLIDMVPGAVDAVPAAEIEATNPIAGQSNQLPQYIAQLLENSLAIASHFDRTERVDLLAELMLATMKRIEPKKRFQLVRLLASQALRSLRKTSRVDRVSLILTQLRQLVTEGQPVAALRNQYATQWHEVVACLLYISSGWMYFGQPEKAIETLDAARELLLDTERVSKDKTHQKYAQVAQAYVTALGQAPAEMALNRTEEMFGSMAKLPNTYTTNSHYSRLHLNIVEDVVGSILSDEFAVGSAARRWLDDDEYLVRRRVHEDMRRSLNQTGFSKE